MIEQNIDEGKPVSYFRFDREYTKLTKNSGTTIRFDLKDSNGRVRSAGDLVWMNQGKMRFKAKITRIELLRILDIPIQLLRDEVAPVEIVRHSDFGMIMREIYNYPITIDMKVYVIYWRRKK